MGSSASSETERSVQNEASLIDDSNDAERGMSVSVDVSEEAMTNNNYPPVPRWLPVEREPGEAQREPLEWPPPPGLGDRAVASEGEASAIQGGFTAGGQCSRCSAIVRRCILLLRQVLGCSLVSIAVILIVAGFVRAHWLLLCAGAKKYDLQLVGVALGLVGWLLFPKIPKQQKEGVSDPTWDEASSEYIDPVGEPASTALFAFKLWNDTSRFKADLEALSSLSGNGADDILGAPELNEIVQKARIHEAKSLADHQAARKKELVERCRAQLDAGISLRRLRQKLRPRCFVLDFVDSSSGSAESQATNKSVHAQVEHLRDAVSFLLTICSPFDEVVLRITSPGGLVSEYGLASAHLQRFRQAGVRFVVCVDTIACSGGYMMACVADRIVASHFAMLGSIGVAASMVNLHRVLEKHDVDYTEFTAGRFKRTIGMFTKNTQEGISKFQEDLDAVHRAFTTHVANGRGDRIEGGVNSAATGEVFLAGEALARGLVDELATSDEYLRRRAAEGHAIFELRPTSRGRGKFRGFCAPFLDMFSNAALRLDRWSEVLLRFGAGSSTCRTTASVSASREPLLQACSRVPWGSDVAVHAPKATMAEVESIANIALRV